MRFSFIDAERAFYPVQVLCRVMEVGRSGFYAWLGRPPSARARTDEVLEGKIDRAFRGSRGTYLSRTALSSRAGASPGHSDGDL